MTIKIERSENMNMMEEIMKNMSQELNCIKHKPVFGLKECLNLLENDFFEGIYELNIDLSEEKNEKAKTKKAKIEVLEKIIPKIVKTIALNSDYKDKLKNIKKNEPTTFYDINFIMSGYLFHFIYKNQDYYVLPNEIIDELNSISKEELKIAEEKNFINKKFTYFLFVYGLFRQNLLLESFQKEFKRELQMNEIPMNDKIVLKDGCYMVPPIEKDEILYNQLLKEVDYQKDYSLIEINNYLEEMSTITFNLANYLNEEESSKTWYLFASTTKNAEEILKEIKKSKKMSKSSEKGLLKQLEVLDKKVRRFIWNGMSRNSKKQERLVKDFTIEELSNTKLSTILKKLPKERITMLCEEYDASNTKTLEKKIIKSFMNDLDSDENFEEILKLSEYNHQKLVTDIAYLLIKGYAFTYQKNQEIYVVVPKEILDCFNEMKDLINILPWDILNQEW